MKKVGLTDAYANEEITQVVVRCLLHGVATPARQRH